MTLDHPHVKEQFVLPTRKTEGPVKESFKAPANRQNLQQRQLGTARVLQKVEKTFQSKQTAEQDSSKQHKTMKGGSPLLLKTLQDADKVVLPSSKSPGQVNVPRTKWVLAPESTSGASSQTIASGTSGSGSRPGPYFLMPVTVTGSGTAAVDLHGTEGKGMAQSSAGSTKKIYVPVLMAPFETKSKQQPGSMAGPVSATNKAAPGSNITRGKPQASSLPSLSETLGVSGSQDHNYVSRHMEEEHRCMQCKVSFSHVAALNKHIFIKHTDKHRFVCYLCCKVFLYRSSLTSHMKKKHSVHFSFSSQHYAKKSHLRSPDKGFIEAQTASEPVQIASQPDNPSQDVPDQPKILVPILPKGEPPVSQGEPSLTCRHCGKSCPTQDLLVHHLQYGHHVTKRSALKAEKDLTRKPPCTKEKVYPCVLCRRSFVLVDSLRRHYRWKHPQAYRATTKSASFIKAITVGEFAPKQEKPDQEQGKPDQEQGKSSPAKYKPISETDTPNQAELATDESHAAPTEAKLASSECQEAEESKVAHTQSKHDSPKCKKAPEESKVGSTQSKLASIKCKQRKRASPKGKKTSATGGQVTQADTTENEASSAKMPKFYVCGFCYKGFPQSKSLSHHLKCKHLQTPPQQTSTDSSTAESKTLSAAIPNMYVCGICSEGFRQALALSKHLKWKHAQLPMRTGNRGDYACGYCEERFHKPSQLGHHVYDKHKDKPQALGDDSDHQGEGGESKETPEPGTANVTSTPGTSDTKPQSGEWNVCISVPKWCIVGYGTALSNVKNVKYSLQSYSWGNISC